mgnify:FL=1
MSKYGPKNVLFTARSFADMSKVKGYYLALLESKSIFPYSIHGLWPQYDKDHWPQFCSKQNFNLERLKPLFSHLHANWHSSRGTEQHFWKHEWEKHGTCTGMTEVEYFRKALECFEKIKEKGIHWIQTHEVKNGIHAIPFSLDWQIGHLNL